MGEIDTRLTVLVESAILARIELLDDRTERLEGQLASATDLGNTYCRENGLPEGDNPKHCINQLAWSLAEYKRRLALLEDMHYRGLLARVMGGSQQAKPDQTVPEPTKQGSQKCNQPSQERQPKL